MYRPHESGDPAGTDTRDSLHESRATPAAAAMGRAGDMYTNGVAKPASGERGAAATELSATAAPRESPREPFWSIENGSPLATPRVGRAKFVEGLARGVGAPSLG